MDLDNEFIHDFIVEATEHLENIENNILDLENDLENEDIIHSMFRSFHTIKGLAGFVEQQLIENIAHKTENLLDACRKGILKTDKKITELILTSSDYLKKICEDFSLIENAEFTAEINEHLQKVVIKAELAFDEEKTEETKTKSIQEEVFDDFFFEEKGSGEKRIPEENEDKEDNKQEEEIKIPEDTPKLGEILIEEKKLSPEEVEGILEKQKTDYQDFKFGEVAIYEEKAQPKDVLKAVRTQQAKPHSKDEYMRISTAKVDNLVDMVGELVIIQSLVEQFVLSKCNANNAFTNNFGRMARITKDLQNLAMYLRMVPLKSTFQKITRIARDTIKELDKDINFSTNGDDTEIDRMITEKLLDPLVHLVKNAVSHGIEPPEEREKAGKPLTGSVKINAYNKRGNIYIEICDDGGGINTEKVYQKALEKKLLDPNKNYSEQEIHELILLPGFSTMEVANNISGRGVGMDVVMTEIHKNGGKVEIKSEKGKGSTFILKIPVNHAILNGTVIDIQGDKYIIPTLNVKQIIQPSEEQWVYSKNKRSRIKVRDEIIPYSPISRLFGIDHEEEPTLVVILELEHKYKALPVRNVIGRQEIVVKPIGEEFSGLKYISGMSILGDGKVSLILDVEHIFKTEGVV